MLNVSGWSDKGLYGCRKVINSDELISWAKEQGFEKVLDSGEFHCTVAYSNKWFEHNNIAGKGKFVTINPSDMLEVTRLGDEGAIVIMIKSDDLTETWKDCISKGATWDYPKYSPHITLTYNNGDIDLSNIELPDFSILLGDLEFSNLDEDYTIDKNSYDVPDPYIIDEQTGIKRPKHILPKEKPVGVLPQFRNTQTDYKEVLLHPKDWFLTQATIMACLPVTGDNKIPLALRPYINSNFNTYPASEMKLYVQDFKQSLLLKNHINSLAYGFTVDVKPREVKVGKLTLYYIDILVAVNKNIDPDFASKIQSQVIKYLSWGHSQGDFYCSVCNTANDMCEHINQMIMRDTPEPAVDSKGQPYGLVHRFNKEFHVYDVSYLDVKPAYDGAITHKVFKLDKPVSVSVCTSF